MTTWLGTADARAALHPAAGEDSRSGTRTADVTSDELQRLIDVIVQETGARRGATIGDARCSLPFGAVSECCPDRLRGVIDAGATRVGVHAIGGAPSDIASMIDHTLLKPDATRKDIEELCREAAQFSFATVCVNPDLGGPGRAAAGGDHASASARSSGFRSARPPPTSKATRPGARSSTARARSTWSSTSARSSRATCAPSSATSRRSRRRAATAACSARSSSKPRFLTDDEKVTACTLAKAAGADYVKTSTGFGPGGATAADVALMRRVVGAEMGVKAAGGVRDLEGLKAMVAAGATRVGASAGVKIVQQARGEKPASPHRGTIRPNSTSSVALRRVKKPCREVSRAATPIMARGAHA